MGPERLLATWQRLGSSAGGRWLFSRLLGFAVPYSGGIRSTVLQLEPGRCRVQLRERRAVRNHLGSVHAIALANLAELASGLSMLSGLPGNARGIVVSLTIDYIKKARGTLVATSEAKAPTDLTEDVEHVVVSEIRDAEGDVVATARVLWRLGPKRAKADRPGSAGSHSATDSAVERGSDGEAAA